jgi:hypothetical protein
MAFGLGLGKSSGADNTSGRTLMNEKSEQSLTMLSLSLSEAAGYLRTAYEAAGSYVELCEASKEAVRLCEWLKQEREDSWMVNLQCFLQS